MASQNSSMFLRLVRLRLALLLAVILLPAEARLAVAASFVALGDLASGSFDTDVNGVSSDGSVVVGQSKSGSGDEAYRWTQAGGMVGLGDLSGGKFDSEANGVSSDGSVVVGESRSAAGKEAFIWDSVNGMRSLATVLAGLGIDFTGWTLESAEAVSDDGLIIVGKGRDPSNHKQAWRVDLSTVGLVDHFILNHDGAGIHCVGESISITALDSSGATVTDYAGSVTLTTQTGLGTWSDGGNGGSFSDAVADDGVATYTFVSGDSGTASFGLSYTSGTASFDIDVYETAATGTRDDDSEGAIAFAPSGFTLTASALSNPPPNPINDPIGTQTAGTSFAVHLTAYGQTATDPVCGVIESYTGIHSLKFWSTYGDPASGTIAMAIGGSAIASSEAAATALAATFSSGQASVSAKYKDVGRIGLSVKDDTVSEPVTGIRGGSALFVVQPANFVITAVQTPVGGANPGATTPAGDVFVAAGSAFQVSVEVRDAEGSLTPNYGNESSPEGITLSAVTLVAPVGGQAGSIGNPSAFSAISPAGTFKATTVSWSEVGATTLRASVADGSYLLSGDTTGSESAVVGRFTPSQFAVAYSAPEFSIGCSSGLFTYSGEPFGFSAGLAPVLSVTAQNAAGATTQNYAGVWWRVTNASLTGRSYASASGSLDTSGLPGTGSDPTIVDNGDGTGTLIFSAGTGLLLGHTSPSEPFDAEISLSINVLDLDAVAFAGNPARFGNATPSNGIDFESGAKTIRYGRVAIQNAHDSELLALAVSLGVEYHRDGVFISNPDDSCSSLGIGDLLLTRSPGSLPTTPSIGNDPLLLGAAGLSLSAPGDAQVGSVDIEVDLGASGAALPWLRYDWPHDGNTDGVPDDNPIGRATFGIYRGNDSVIFIREVY